MDLEQKNERHKQDKKTEFSIKDQTPLQLRNTEVTALPPSLI
jgi:hypothetical protein